MKSKPVLFLFALAAVAGIWRFAFAYDGNADGMSDVFADHYGLAQDSAQEDADGDGHTNLEESILGTDPLTRNGPLTEIEMFAPGTAVFRYDSAVGKKYRIEFSDDLFDWSTLGNDQPGTGSEIAFGLQSTSAKGFLRIRSAGVIDHDGDGLSLYEENLLGTDDRMADTDGDHILDVDEYRAGTQPAVPDAPPAVSFDPAPGDYQSAQTIELRNLALPDYIYYTTDGSEPTLFSTKYEGTPVATGPDELLTIRAKVILPDGSESPESSATYRVGTYAEASRTVYYGCLKGQTTLGYADDLSELELVPEAERQPVPMDPGDGNLAVNRARRNYLVMGPGWILNGEFVPDTDGPSRELYYGMTAARDHTGTWHELLGFSTDEEVFWDGRIHLNVDSSFYNYRAVGRGWVEAYDAIRADAVAEYSRPVYLMSLGFRLGNFEREMWLYSTETDDQFGWNHWNRPPGYAYYSFPVGPGWVLGEDRMRADTSGASTPVYLASANSFNGSTLPRQYITSIHEDVLPGGTERTTRLSDGWPEGHLGMVPDRSKPPLPLFYGEHRDQSFVSGILIFQNFYRLYTPYPDKPGGGGFYSTANVALARGYTTGHDEYILVFDHLPRTVFSGEDAISPSGLGPEPDVLAYDEGDLATSPAPELLGSGWIENNEFIEYIDDEDGLDLAGELAAGTNPAYFDTDGDLIPDAFEAASAHLDPLVADPLRGEDFDGDGLDTYLELINGSDPDEFDTDGDTVGDGDEVDYGTDPFDDDSKPFDPYDFVGPTINDPNCQPIGDLGVFTNGGSSSGYSVAGTVGDPSSSESERWRLLFGRNSGNRKAESQEFGVVDEFELNLHAGTIFEITLEHVATNLGDSPDYDYEATLTDIEGFLLSDPDSLLGTGSDVDIATVEGYKAYLAPIKSVSFSESFSGGDAVGPRYRKVALNGRPMPDEKPEQESETEQYAEESYVDAFDLSLHHDTSYIYTPLASSDLVLQVTASVRETGWSDRGGLKPHEQLTMPFGASWTSNLCAYVEAVETYGDVPTDPITVNVVDESGRSQRFGTTDLLAFFPWPSSRVDKKTWLNKLEGYDTDTDGVVDRLVYTKKYGTQLTYDLCDAWFMYSTDRVEGSNEVKKHRYWRLTEVVDRYGNDLVYDYGTSEVALIPQVIQSNSHPNQFIAVDRSDNCRRVESITDSRGNTIGFNYQDVRVFDTTLTQLTSVDYPDGTSKEYTYETVLDIQNDDGRITNHFHGNIKQIKDKAGNAHTFHYSFDRSKSYYASGSGSVEFAVNINYLPQGVEDDLTQQLAAINAEAPPGTAEYKQMYGIPRLVTQVDLPDSIGSATFAKTPETETVYGPDFSAASGTTVTDALGHVTAYAFGGIDGEIVDVDAVGNTLSTEWMIYYTQMEVHHGALEGEQGHLGKETFVYDLASGLSLASMTDFSGNTTSWTFDEDVPTGLELPELTGAANFMTKWADPTSKTDALGRTESYEYGNYRIMSEINDVHGTVTSFTIDSMGRRKSKTVTDAGGTKLLEETYTFADEDVDPLNDDFPGFMVEKRVVAYQNLSGEAWEQDLVTKYVPDNRGRLWKEIVDPEGLALTSEFDYDLNNNRTSVTDPRNNETIYTYDKLNRLIQITYPVAGTGYDDTTGLPIETATTKRLLYNERGNLVCEIDENGHHTLHFHDALGRKTHTVRDMDGAGLPALPPLAEPQIITLDPAAHITPADLVTEYAYNPVNSLESTTDPRGTVTKNYYDALQRLTHTYAHYEPGDADATGTETGATVTDSPEKNHTEFLYDPAQNTGASGFDTEGFKPTQIIYHNAVRGAEGPSGLWTLNSHFTYDADYRQTQSRIEYTPGNFNQTDTAYGTITGGKEALVSTVTDARGKVTRTSLDGLKRSTLVQHALGTTDQIQTQTFYTSTGLAWKTIDPNGNETQTEYDLAARPVKVWQSDPATGLVHPSNSPVTETIYDAASNIAVTINPLGNRWDYTHDARNRRTKEEAPAVINAESGLLTPVRPVTETYFDGVGNVIATKDPRGAVTETDFDRANRPTALTTPAVPVFGVSGDIHLSSATHYDKNSNVVKVTDYEGNATVNFYDKLNRLKATGTNPATGQPSEIEGSPNTGDILVSSAYDDASNLIRIIDGEGAVTGFRHDGLARRTKTIWDEGADLERIKTMTHDALVLTQRTDEMGKVTQYLYDDLHRLEDVVYVGRTTDNRRYTYDDNSNILTVTHPNEVNTLRDTASTWDALDRLIGETSADVSHTYTLDKAGNRLTTTYGQTNLQVVSTYDALNRLATLTEGSRVTTYAYNLNGDIVEKGLPNDVTVACSFDLLGRKKASTNIADGAAQPFAQYGYAHDKQGNLVEIDEIYPLGNLTARTVTNTYDKVYRLDTETIAVSGGSITFTDYDYDDAHNRIQKSVTVDTETPVATSYNYGDGSTASTANSNQIVSFTEGSNAVSFTYDANGNRASRNENSQTDSYSYDYENRLLNFDKQNGADAGDHTWTYDPRTRRVEFDKASGSSVTVFSFSGGTSAQEYTTSTTTPEVEYVRGSDYGGGIGGILYTLRSGVPSIKHYNSRGDIVAATGSTGILTWQSQYEAFGEIIAETGSTADREKSNTKPRDVAGYVYEGQRIRDIETDRYLTRDPLGFADGVNVYIHVRQSPWTHWDAHGLKTGSIRDRRNEMFDIMATFDKNGAERERAKMNQKMDQAQAEVEIGADLVALTPPGALVETVSIVSDGKTLSGEDVGDGERVLEAGMALSSLKIVDKVKDANDIRKKVDKLADVGGDTARELNRPLRAGDEGLAGDLQKQRRKHGSEESLHVDHQPSFAAQVKAEEKRLGRELEPAEKRQLMKQTPAVASPAEVHRKTSPTYGGRNTPAQIDVDSADLDAARSRDRAEFDKAMEDR